MKQGFYKAEQQVTAVTALVMTNIYVMMYEQLVYYHMETIQQINFVKSASKD
jgi:hypothetical protein